MATMNEPNHFFDVDYHPLNEPDRRWEVQLQIAFVDCEDSAGAWANLGAQTFAANRETALEKMSRVLEVIGERMAKLKR
jgi:hypothetical protein